MSVNPPTSTAQTTASPAGDAGLPNGATVSGESTPPVSDKGFWQRLYPGPLIRAGAALLGGFLLGRGHHHAGGTVAGATLGAVIFSAVAHVALRVHAEDGFHNPDRVVHAAYKALHELVPEAMRQAARSVYGAGRDIVTTAARNFDEWSPPNYVGGSHQEIATNYLPEPTLVRLGVGKHKILEGALTELQEAHFLDSTQGRFEWPKTPDGLRRELTVEWTPLAAEGSQHKAEMTFLVPRTVNGEQVLREEKIRFAVQRPQIGPLGAHLDLELAKESATRRVRDLVQDLMQEPPPTDAAGKNVRKQRIALAHELLKEDLGVAVSSLDPEHPRREAMQGHLETLHLYSSKRPQNLLEHLNDLINNQLPRVTVSTHFQPPAAARANAKSAAEKVLNDVRALRPAGHPSALGKTQAEPDKDAEALDDPQKRDEEHDQRVGNYIEKRKAYLEKLKNSDSQPYARIAEYLLSLSHQPESLWTLQPLINVAEVRFKRANAINLAA